MHRPLPPRQHGVVVEATPEPDPACRDQVMRWLTTWPVVEIPGAGRDLHLEQPDRWQRCLTSFLAAI
ncbi:MAG: hypothetical protein JF887_01075 [Candidatus Dormibacteraeota bacterium]|uniref:Alpha/beta hydrolase n=1 Tax=Candidatus Amunia macphersoniae TaxID=3127014 RepID=A0A934KMT9_9BACT|nr:hypothetical protein [Candidatus Dormibacteraeota bacterium]